MTGQPPAAANAAVALTQLHQWETDFVSIPVEAATSQQVDLRISRTSTPMQI